MKRVVVSLFALWLASCAAAPPPPPRPVVPARRLGDAMNEAGMRFNRIGRAVLAERWELATYDLAELQEIFEDDLASSSWHDKPKLPALAHKFQTEQLGALTAAIHGRDRAASQQAVAQTARACNECHKTADMAYIEISEQPGAQVPVVDAQR